MNERISNPPPAGLNLGDIYHVLFRHKWKILIIWAIGMVTASVVWFASPAKYKSETTVLVSYVREAKSLDPVVGGETSTKMATGKGDAVINTELAILRSYDLAAEVANLVGPQKILAKLGGGSDPNVAASVVSKGLTIEAASGDAVISITFESKDPTIVRPVLEQVIISYKKKHIETHLLNGVLDDFLIQQSDQNHNQLVETENRLREAKNKVGITSLDSTKKEQAENLTRVENDIYTTQSELAGHIATFNEMTNLVLSAMNHLSATNAGNTTTNVSATNGVDSALSTVPQDIMDRYRRICTLIENAEKQQTQLEMSFTPDSPMVQGVHENLQKNNKQKVELETLYPALIGSHSVAGSTTGTGTQSDFSSSDLAREATLIKSLQARLNLHQARLAEIRKQMGVISAAEAEILDLQRKRDSYEQSYQYFQSRIERARFDEQLGPGRMPNISTIQQPSPPYRNWGNLPKMLLMILAGTGFGGIAIAFVLELYFDRSFKRPIEIEKRLQAPLFMSIPRTKLKNRLLPGVPQRLLGAGEKSTSNGTSASVSLPDGTTLEVSPWQQDKALRPFFEALRDRLIMSFELRNLVHNPKLVAVTSCGDGAGVSTVASGLAASLSETGEGNVLLVDMNNVGQGAAHYFRKGKLEVGLDEALEGDKRESAMVQENLYVVAENASNETLPRVLHKRFSSLLPRLKASDYDYIIFDMPPVNQISPTSKLARFMDMVFMVVEAEKTDRDAVERATAILEESKAHVGIVLNKSKNYVPKRLQHEV